MANDHYDGFGHYGVNAAGAANMLKGVYAEVGGYQPQTTDPRTGTIGLVDTSGAGNGASIIRRPFKTASSKKFVGKAWKLNALPGSNVIFCFCHMRTITNTDIATFALLSTGAIAIRGGDINSANLVVSDPVAFVAGVYQHVECMLDVAGQAAEVRVNGVTVASVSGHNFGGTDISQWAAGKEQAGGVGLSPKMADMRAGDASGTINNDFMGDRRVFTDFPVSDGSPVTFTPSTGATAFPCVDETAPNDNTDYIEATAVGNKARMGFAAVAAGVASINGIGFANYAEKTDVGDSSLRVNAVSGATDLAGTERALSQAYNYMPFQDFGEDPAASAPWTPTTANAMLVELERTL